MSKKLVTSGEVFFVFALCERKRLFFIPFPQVNKPVKNEKF